LIVLVKILRRLLYLALSEGVLALNSVVALKIVLLRKLTRLILLASVAE
jgi:hypothetical protein